MCNSIGRPFITPKDPKLRRQLAGPMLTQDEINFAAATKAAQIGAGSQIVAGSDIVEIMRVLDRRTGKVRHKNAERSRDLKAAKARD